MSRSTAPQDRISLPRKVVYGIGGFVNNLLAQGIGNMPVVLTLALGMDFRAVGLLGMIPRAFDAVTDPLVGFASDKTRSRWGRRRPWLFVGAIAAGVVFVALWQMPAPTQLRVQLVDGGGEDGEEVADEVSIIPPALEGGRWVSVDIPLADFDQLAVRQHLAEITLSGDLTEFVVDNIYLYRAGDGSPSGADASPEPPPVISEGQADSPAGGQADSQADSQAEGQDEGQLDGQAGGQTDAQAVPNTPAPTPAAAPADVISIFSDAYDDLPGQTWSVERDGARMADVVAGGDPARRFTGLWLARIELGTTPLDASEATHLHLDLWTPEQIDPGRSQSYYFWYFLIGSLVFFLAYTVFATPWVALGYELTPDYNERTRLMGVQSFVSNLAFLVGPWMLVIMTNPVWFRNQMAGARFVAAAICAATIALGILPAIFLRERVPAGRGAAASQPGPTFWQHARDFARGMARTVGTGPFLLLCIATFLVFNSFIMISQFQFWVFAFHVSGGDIVDGAALAGVVGTVGIVANFAVIALVTALGTRIGKKRAFYVSTGISMFGYALKWFCYTPDNPALALLPAPFLAFGLGGLFTLMGSMIADVVDMDELETGERREGMFGSVFWWVVKVGQSVALGAGGFLLYSTGLDPALGASQPDGAVFWVRFYDAFVPLAASGLAILAVSRYPLTEERSRQVREELERRRGALS